MSDRLDGSSRRILFEKATGLRIGSALVPNHLHFDASSLVIDKDNEVNAEFVDVWATSFPTTRRCRRLHRLRSPLPARVRLAARCRQAARRRITLHVVDPGSVAMLNVTVTDSAALRFVSVLTADRVTTPTMNYLSGARPVPDRFETT